MTGLSDYFLTSLLAYGAWALGLVTMLSGIGFPVPATMTLLAAGAFVQQGMLNWQSAAVLAICGAILGDNISYLIGRFGGAMAPPRVRASQAWQKAEFIFRRWGALAIFLSRFLITPLALPINLMAGSTRYAMWRYAGIVVVGEIVWVIMFVSGGYLFADRWEALNSVVRDLSGLLVGAALFIVSGVYLLHRAWRGQRLVSK